MGTFWIFHCHSRSSDRPQTFNLRNSKTIKFQNKAEMFYISCKVLTFALKKTKLFTDFNQFTDLSMFPLLIHSCFFIVINLILINIPIQIGYEFTFFFVQIPCVLTPKYFGVSNYMLIVQTKSVNELHNGIIRNGLNWMLSICILWQIFLFESKMRFLFLYFFFFFQFPSLRISRAEKVNGKHQCIFGIFQPW